MFIFVFVVIFFPLVTFILCLCHKIFVKCFIVTEH